MFDLSLAELALVVVTGVVFIGPKELPTVIKAVAKAMSHIRKLGTELRTAFEDIANDGVGKEARDTMYEMRMIKGDDGKYYESYTPPQPKPEAPDGNG